MTIAKWLTKLSTLTKVKAATQLVLCLLNGTPNERNPFAEAMQWVAVLTTVGLEMVLPGLAGQWLDRRFGTRFLVLAGFALGLSIGLWHLIQLTKANPNLPKRKE